MRSRATVQSPAGFDRQTAEPKYLQSARGLPAQNFKMNVRLALTAFPVPCLRAETDDTVTVLDVCPKGEPDEIEGEGLAWIDVVDTDVLAGDPDACSARVGITSTAVQFGSRSFNSAATKPIEFVMGTNAGEIVGRVLTNRAWRLGSDAGAGGHVQGPWVASNDSDHAVAGGYAFTVRNIDTGTGSYARQVVQADVNTAELRAYSAAFSFDTNFYLNAAHVLSTAGKLILSSEVGNDIVLIPSNAQPSTVTAGFRITSDAMLPRADNVSDIGSAAARVENVFAAQIRPGAGTPIWTSGAGSPEGALVAPVGSLYTRTNGGAGTTLYVKESGAGNTGWVAK